MSTARPDRNLALELVRVTEAAALAAARVVGMGDKEGADQAAVDAMRRELNKLPIEGTIVIGEGERDEAPMLFIGEKVGMNAGPQVDIAVDPLEGTTLCAKNMPGAIATMAMADGGTLLHAPDVYMEKIAIGPGYAKNTIDLDAAPAERSPSPMRRMRAPASRTSSMSFLWRVRSRTMTVRSSMSRLSLRAMDLRLSLTGASMSMTPREEGPTTILSM